MTVFKQNRRPDDRRPATQHFTASYKTPKTRKLTYISIFAEDSHEAAKKAPNTIVINNITNYFYGIS